jgi:hypothetical protein
MTLYSTYGTGRLRLVDGDLSPDDDELRAEQLHQITSTLACGVIRMLLDTCTDRHDPDRPVHAEEWHTPEEGWELDAVGDEDQPGLLRQVGWFTAAALPHVLALAERIAWDEVTRGQVWHGDTGMGLYRVGMLLGHHGARTGIGFADYTSPSDRRDALPTARSGSRRGYRGLPGQLTWWADTHLHPGWSQAWIDGREDPCLLHLQP